MSDTLVDLLRQMFPDSGFDPEDPKLGVGSFAEWDSLGHYNFLLMVEQNYGFQFSPDELGELKTLAQIRQCLTQKGVDV